MPKKNPDRTISTETRPINDMRAQNSHGAKEDHPPAFQPKHERGEAESLVESTPPARTPEMCQKECPEGVQMAFHQAPRCCRVLH